MLGADDSLEALLSEEDDFEDSLLCDDAELTEDSLLAELVDDKLDCEEVELCEDSLLSEDADDPELAEDAELFDPLDCEELLCEDAELSLLLEPDDIDPLLVEEPLDALL